MKHTGKYTGFKDCKNKKIQVGNIIKIVNQDRFFEVCYAEQDDKFYVKSNNLSAFLKDLIKQFPVEIIKENSIDEFIFDTNDLSLSEIVYKIVKKKLDNNDNNIHKTAVDLKITRSRLYRIIRLGASPKPC